MKRHRGWIPVLALVAVVVALGDQARAQVENAPRDRNRVPALLLTDPITGVTDRWESDGDGAAAVSIKSGSLSMSGPVTVQQGGATVITAPWPVILSDGTAAVGTLANPLRNDPTGTTIQPVSGTVTANVGTTGGLALETSLSSIDGKIPASPATDRTTAGAPFSNRLSDGTSFYDATKTGQLPAALSAGSNLKVSLEESNVDQAVSVVQKTSADGNFSFSDTTEQTVLAAGGAGVFHDMKLIVVGNDSNTDLLVEVRDSTGGSIRLNVPAASVEGGAVVPFEVDLPQPTANNPWTAKMSANPVGGNVEVFFQAVVR